MVAAQQRPGQEAGAQESGHLPAQANPFVRPYPPWDDVCVLRFYLGQNKWVDLARAVTGHPAWNGNVALHTLEETSW